MPSKHLPGVRFPEDALVGERWRASNSSLGGVAQLVEHWIPDPKAVSSSLATLKRKPFPLLSLSPVRIVRNKTRTALKVPPSPLRPRLGGIDGQVAAVLKQWFFVILFSEMLGWRGV